MSRFIRTVFLLGSSSSGLLVKGGRLEEGDIFSDRVGVGDEAFAWGVLENLIELKEKNFWGHDMWYNRWMHWTLYVAKARKNPLMQEIEGRAWEVTTDLDKCLNTNLCDCRLGQCLCFLKCFLAGCFLLNGSLNRKRGRM